MNHTGACSKLLFIVGDSISGERWFPGVCVVLQQWGCWALCVAVRTNVAGCAARTCGWTPCCGTPASARSWFSWSPRSRPLLGLLSPPNWTEGWTPRERSDGHFPPILTCETEPLTACPPNTPWLARCAASESVSGAVTIRVQLLQGECPRYPLMCAAGSILQQWWRWQRERTTPLWWCWCLLLAALQRR